MAQLDNDDGTYRCLNCGRNAVPLDFAGWEEYQDFLQTNPAKEEEKGPTAIPLIPALFDLGRDASFVSASVANITWNDGIIVGEERADLAAYWRTIEKASGSKAACLLDIYGILHGKPDLDELQRIMRRRSEVMLDIGIRNEQDIFDSFTMGASSVLACSFGMISFKVFERVLDMTDECIPCLCHTDKVQWGRQRGNPTDLSECLARLKEIGHTQVAVMDLTRLGTGRGPDLRTAYQAAEVGFDVWVAGGVRAEDVQALPKEVAGVLLDPVLPFPGQVTLG